MPAVSALRAAGVAVPGASVPIASHSTCSIAHGWQSVGGGAEDPGGPLALATTITSDCRRMQDTVFWNTDNTQQSATCR